jgi:hypothetical protein
MTNSDGTMSTFTDDLPGGEVFAGPVAGVCASADTGAQSRAAIIIAWKRGQ